MTYERATRIFFSQVAGRARALAKIQKRSKIRNNDGSYPRVLQVPPPTTTTSRGGGGGGGGGGYDSDDDEEETKYNFTTAICVV
eukprot:1490570-Ditylum_brightwellii.AAC.1